MSSPLPAPFTDSPPGAGAGLAPGTAAGPAVGRTAGMLPGLCGHTHVFLLRGAEQSVAPSHFTAGHTKAQGGPGHRVAKGWEPR